MRLYVTKTLLNSYKSERRAYLKTKKKKSIRSAFKKTNHALALFLRAKGQKDPQFPDQPLSACQSQDVKHDSYAEYDDNYELPLKS